MANRLQHVLLKRFIKRLSVIATVSVGVLTPWQASFADDIGSTKDIDTEFFDLGLTAGVINIENFGSELIMGLSGTFKATEDFFLQLNYQQADAGYSSYEKALDISLRPDRTYKHYDLLLGYNVFQGEVFSGKAAGLSSLYLVAGVGDTAFGSDSAFTYTFGLGYQMALSRRTMLRLDYRDYMYESSLDTGDSEELVVDVHMSAGLSWLF